MVATADLELYAFFEKRLGSTYALSEAQKIEILSHSDELDAERMANILKIVTEYENIIEKDSRSHLENEDRETDRLAVREMLDDITF
jgi:hypothetical protein